MGILTEHWASVPGYGGHYEASSEGRIKSIGRYRLGKQGKPTRVTERILRPGVTRDGYEYVILCRDGRKKYASLHRLIAMAFVPNVLGLPGVNHVDCNKRNNHASNLAWVTRHQNVSHAVSLGRFPTGENHWRRK